MMPLALLSVLSVIALPFNGLTNSERASYWRSSASWCEVCRYNPPDPVVSFKTVVEWVAERSPGKDSKQSTFINLAPLPQEVKTNDRSLPGDTGQR